MSGFTDHTEAPLSIVKAVQGAPDAHVPKLVRLLGTPAPEGSDIEQQRTNMVTWLEKRRVDDHKSVIEDHPYEQVVPPEHVLKNEQCFGRYFSAAAPYCAEKCAFALKCVETLEKSVKSILSNGSSLTEAKEGLTKQERKKQMAKEIKKANAPVKAKNPEPEELEEEEPVLADEDEVLEEEDEEPAPKKKAAPAPAKKAPAKAEEEDEEVEEEEAPEEDEEEAPEEEEEPEEEPAPKKKAAPAPAKKKAPEPEPEEDEEVAEEEEPEEEPEEEEEPAPKKKAPAKTEAPKKPEPAKKAAAPTEKLAKKVPALAPFGADVLIKLTVTENPLKGSDSAHDLVNEAMALAGAEGRITQQQLFDCIAKIFIVGDEQEEKENVLKGIAEELKDKGILKLVRVKTA